MEFAAVEPGVELPQRAGVGAPGVFSLTEASTRRRAVAVGGPIAASSGSSWPNAPRTRSLVDALHDALDVAMPGVVER